MEENQVEHLKEWPPGFGQKDGQEFKILTGEEHSHPKNPLQLKEGKFPTRKELSGQDEYVY